MMHEYGILFNLPVVVPCEPCHDEDTMGECDDNEEAEHKVFTCPACDSLFHTASMPAWFVSSLPVETTLSMTFPMYSKFREILDRATEKKIFLDLIDMRTKVIKLRASYLKVW